MAMRNAFLLLALPCGAALLACGYRYPRRWCQGLGGTLALGCFAGVVSTCAYDLARVPFHAAGLRVFDPVLVYGIWIADASASSWHTTALGWCYHFYNGISFAIMYALFMRGRSIVWAILWGLLLETIALYSPAGPIFGVYGNSPAIIVAYLGHVAYGLPLGYLVKHWDHGTEWLQRLAPVLRHGTVTALSVVLLSAVWPAHQSPDSVAADAPSLRVVADQRLSPDFLRLGSTEVAVSLMNDTDTARDVIIKQLAQTVTLAAGAQKSVKFPRTGIFQVFVATEGRTRSSLVIVEPVEADVGRPLNPPPTPQSL